MSEFKFEITEHIATLSEKANGWTKELNKVSWNDRPPKYDIRDWDPDHGKMSKGIGLNDDEITALKDALNSMSQL
ncbi:YdbC family protein [Peptoniphilus equinus]|uniref:YdbC family protein n=1 Tax=Peptoniphilus equinus TaxID=3016343 RepID=A0ABY7QV62_9FIRM|nr:YdbC family protein [Peptoniphilus equinus]WBW50160.1 YdbC family protein [Peptoniphilus equinus]